ncbi:hypothetical protein [Maridesulfovibrio sp.]
MDILPKYPEYTINTKNLSRTATQKAIDNPLFRGFLALINSAFG